ncbi:unnamed protein product [Closterium sp. NIES-53]
MTTLRVLSFDPEGRPVAFDTWHDDLQLYLLSDLKDSVSLFDHVSGAAPAPPATADVSTRSQWLSRDATTRLAIRNQLPATECAHFGEHRTAQALYDALVARYSSPATSAIGWLLLPYMFPELSAFAAVADLVTHLRTSDARYRTTVPAEDHFLTLDPTSLNVELLKQHLFAAETSAVAVGAARGTPRSPFFEGCSPSPLSPSFTSAAAADVSVAEDVDAASTSAKRRSSKGKGGRGGGGGSGGGGGGSGSGGGGSGGGGGGSGGGGGGGTGGSSGGPGGGGGVSGGSGGSGGSGTGGGRFGPRHGGFGGGRGQHHQRRSKTQSPQQLREYHTERRCFARLVDAWRVEFGDDVEHPRWAQLLQSGVAVFDLDYDVIIFAMYALSFSAEGNYYRCVPPDPGIATVALGASASGTPPGTAPAKALHTFTLDSGASPCFIRDSTTLTPLPAPVLVRLFDPSWGPVIAHSSTVLPCPAVPSGSLSGLHLPSFSTNFVSTAALQDAMVTTTIPGGQRVSICTCTRSGHHLATFTRRPGSNLYTLATEPPRVAASAQVSVSGQVAPHCSCRLLSHQTLLWHHSLGHPSLPRLRGMYSCLLDSGLPRSLPPLPPLPAPPCLPCVEGRQRAAPHSSFPPTTAPLGGEFSSDLLRDFCRGEGINQSFTLQNSPQQNGIAERRIGLVMEFYHPTSRLFLQSQDVTFDESVTFYCLFPYHSAPPPPPPLFLAPGPPSVDPLPPQGRAPSGVSRVDPLPGTALVQIAVVSGAAPGAASGGATSGGAASGEAELGGAGSQGAWSGGAEPEGVEPGGAEPQGAALPRGRAGASLRLSRHQLREWLVRRPHRRNGAPGAGGAGDTGARGAAVPTGAVRTGGVGCAGAGDPTEPRAVGAVGAGAGVDGVGGPGAVGTEATGVGVKGTSAGGAGAEAVRAVDPGASGAGDTVWPQPEQSGGLIEHHFPASCPVLPVRSAHRAPRSGPPPVPGTHTMALRPSSVPLRVLRPAPPESYLPEVPDHESDRVRAASPTFTRLLATAVTDPYFESAAASALVAELLDFAAACPLDYATALVAEFVSASPPSVRGECALGTDVLENRLEDFECLATAVPRFASMLLAPEGDPDAPDISTPCSYAKAITGPYSSQWQAAMDAEMASWKSTGTYVDEVPPPEANIVDGMWIFRYSLLAGQPARGDLAAPTTWFHWAIPAGTQWSLRLPVYGLCKAPREWHDTFRTTLAALGFAPSTADPSLFLRTDTSLPPFYILVYVLQRFGFQYSSPQLTPLSTSHSLSAPPSDKSVEPSGPYPELVGCLMYLITCTRPDLAYPFSFLARYVAPVRGMGLVLGGRDPIVLTGHADASWVDDSATQWSSQGYTCSLVSGYVSWRSTRSSSVLSSSCEAEIYAGAMAAQELCWLTYLLTDLGEQPCSPPQRGQLPLAYVATWANTAGVFTKPLPPGDHQHFVTLLGLVPTLPHLLVA